MAFRKILELKKEDGVALDVVPVELSLTEATALYVVADLGCEDKFTFNPSIQVHRLVDVSEGCEPELECVPYAETCNMVYLAPGKYSITACPLEGKYHKEVEEARVTIKLIGETMTKVDKDVLEMNAKLGC